MEAGTPFGVSPSAGVRGGQEFAGDNVRNDLGQYSISGLDFLLSLRNNQSDTSSYSLLQSANCDGLTPEDPTLTYDVLSLQHTQLSRYGSKVRSVYSAELKHNLYQAAELGLPSYGWHVLHLTSPTNVSDLNTTQQGYNVYYGALRESSAFHQYRERTSSVAFAASAPVNDVLIVDRTGYWARDASGYPTGHLFHSKIFQTPDDGTSFYTYCYKTGGVCSTASTNAGVVIFATHPDLNDLWPGLDPEWGAEENQASYRSRGGLFSAPGTLYPPAATVDGLPDFDYRRTAQNQFMPEFINALWYRFDGLNSLAVKQAGSDSRYLHNQIVDAHPTNVGWNGPYDGLCYTSDFISSIECDRPSTNYWVGACAWNWPGF